MLQIKFAIFRIVMIFAMVGVSLAMSLDVRAATPGTVALLTLDPAHTTIHFTLPTFTHTVHGTFLLKSGVIRINPQTQAASGEIVIDAKSGQTGNTMRDSRMKNSILDVAKYPEIRFVAHRVQIKGPPLGEFHAKLIGTIFLHGSSHDLTLYAVITRSGDILTLKTNFAVPYVRWGLEDPSVLFLTVSKQVYIDVTGSAHLNWVSKTAVPAQSSAPPRSSSHS